MNRYPTWKYALMVVAIILGALYSAPNLFPFDPAVQVSLTKGTDKADEALLARVKQTLDEGNVPYKDGFVDTSVGAKVRFDNEDIQAQAKDLLESKLDEKSYTVALNQISDVPEWMEKINAKPVYLGLDLRGGVHFLLQVDMDGAMVKAADRNATDLRSFLREKKISNRGVVREGQTVVMRFRDAEAREKARTEISRSSPELQLTDSANSGADDWPLVASINAEEQRKIRENAITQNIVTLRNRVNELGVAEPIVQQSGAERIVVQLPGVQDTAHAKEILGRTASLEIRMVNDEAGALEAALRGQIPYGSDLYANRDGTPILLRRQVVLTGDRINDAQAGFTEFQEPAVHVRLDSAGARIFKDVTRENVGKRMAIVLVEKNTAEVITAPVIREEIGGGRVQISGSMTSREANDIALLMRAGALAAPMEIVEERTVGPSMGKDNIDRGFNSVVGGFIALMLFICMYYMGMGVISAISLSVNLMLLIGLLSALQATLTLPGIAAIALTLGMAIDANVLINERIREELRWGASPHVAIQAGYERAWATIVDSNITNLIAGIALFLFGTGPVRGFAVVHCLGIMTSVFSAVFISRGLVSLVYGRKKHLEKISIGQVWKPPVEDLAANFAAPDGAARKLKDK